ncbi:MAG: zinc-binding dehydrogenase [Solirubrobacterales bacterium]|nr:zinc-binding dehydrogenase [Solirubrobacterales bacterium]
MRAAVVSEPGGPEVLRVEERPTPEARPGWVLVRVRGFGLNRSELGTRRGDSGDAVRFPRVLGIECVGEVAEAPGSDLEPGRTVVAAMGGMGREFDGGYAECALLPREHVIPISTTLPWSRLAALPETFATAWGSVVKTLRLERGETILVRGGSSSVGMAAITIASELGATVIATTRQEAKRAAMEEQGADHVVIDPGSIAEEVRRIAPDGVDALFELVGPRVIADSVAAVRSGGRVCLSGYLAESWDVDSARAAVAAAGASFATFGSIEVSDDAYREPLQAIVEAVESGRYRDGLARVFELDEIADAHRLMEDDGVAGKVVVLTGADGPAG